MPILFLLTPRLVVNLQLNMHREGLNVQLKPVKIYAFKCLLFS